MSMAAKVAAGVSAMGPLGNRPRAAVGGRDTGHIVASVLTDKDADDGSQVGPLLDQVDGPVASFTGDGAFDRDDVYAAVAANHPSGRYRPAALERGAE